MNILVAGAGQLGSRHLQSLANISKYSLNIDVVDPSFESLEVAKQRYESLRIDRHIVNYKKNISDTKHSSYELVIVATNSNVRCEVVKNIIKQKKLKFLILEKILFQKIEEYYEIEELLSTHNVLTWVNHPRRMFDFYNETKNKILNSKDIYFSATAGNWGLACNALHLLDLFSFLANSEIEEVDLSKLSPKILKSKRDGFIEIDGEISGKLIGGHKYSISHYTDNRPLSITISSSEFSIYIDEKSGISIQYLSNANPEIFQGEIAKYQSQLTEEIFYQLILTEKCLLPTYAEAMSLHLKFIDPLINFINTQQNTKLSACPIT